MRAQGRKIAPAARPSLSCCAALASVWVWRSALYESHAAAQAQARAAASAATAAPARPWPRPWATFAARVAAMPRPSSHRASAGTGHLAARGVEHHHRARVDQPVHRQRDQAGRPTGLAMRQMMYSTTARLAPARIGQARVSISSPLSEEKNDSAGASFQNWPVLPTESVTCSSSARAA